MYTDSCCWGAGHDAVDLSGEQWTNERWVCLEHAQQVEVARKRDAHRLTVADNIDTMGLGDVTIEVGLEILKGLGVGANQDVAILETIRLGLLIEFHSEGHIFDGDIGVAPPEENL